MRELEGQAVSDVSSEVAGRRTGSAGLCLLARPREMAMIVTKRAMLFMMAVRCGGSREAEESCDIKVTPASLSFMHLLHFHD